MHVARLGGYYNLKYYRRCDHLIANTRAIVDYAVANGWPRARIDYLPNFVPDFGAATPCSDRVARRAARSCHRPVASEQRICFASRSAGDDARGPSRDCRRRSVARYARKAGARSRRRRPGSVSRLVRRRPGVARQSRFSRLPIAARTAGQCRDRGLVGGAAGHRHGQRWTRRADRGSRSTACSCPLPGQPGGGPTALAAAIERLCRSPELRRHLGQGGRRAYEAEFTEAAVVARYRGFFDRLAPLSAAHHYG